MLGWLTRALVNLLGIYAAAGKIRAVIATDMLAHGIDWSKFTTLVNFDHRIDLAHYVTRACRVGRWLQQGGRPFAACHTYF